MANPFSNSSFPFMKCVTGLFIFIALFACHIKLVAQPGAEVELNKPAQYENRKLASEKTGEKKFTLLRRFMQNTTTHYNYFFNANNRLNDVVSRAKAAFKDDYSELLPYYNYTIEGTAQDKSELDSVIYKATAGILLHDLRSDWVDNMYLLMGKAYLFRNELDSANMTFQYMNYAFAPKEDGYDIPIGSNASNEIGEFSIATKEKNSLAKKITSRAPSRNASFIWSIRAYIEHNELPEAAGLIEILKSDPNFPKRLQGELDEVTAYWFYKQDVYDSAASYLSNALNEDQAANNAEKARWEYLVGQLYQRTGHEDLAAKYFGLSIKHTIDPVMDVYARLNTLKLNRGDDKNYVQQNLDALLKMARKDKYENYRDILYFAAATIEMDRKNYDAAEKLLIKSTTFSNNNPRQRSEAFLLLADMNFDLKKYTPASNYYDSTDINSLKTQDQKDRVILRKPPLKIIAANELVVFSQDSLQALAQLAPEKRDAVIKSKLKELRKLKGLKEDDQSGGSSNPAIRQDQAADLFGDNSKNTDFYFYNASLKSRGFNEFKTKWGQRSNVDNWRRLAAANQQNNMASPDQPITDVLSADGKTGPTELSYEGLLADVPLTEEKLTASNTSIEKALNNLGETFMSGLEDYPSAIEAYEELLKRFPNSDFKDKALFNLVYAYLKTGDKDRSEAYKKQLIAASDTSKYAQLLKNPGQQKKNDLAASPATKKYEQIYNMFIEGDFENAKAEKKLADSLYDKSYWTPQLLYIESIYYVSKREDSTAIKVLNDLAGNFSTNPMAEKAKTMIDVLKRRSEIEDYLTKLEVNRNIDTTVASTYVKPRQEIAQTDKPIIASGTATLKPDSTTSNVVVPVPSVELKKMDAQVAKQTGGIKDSTKSASVDIKNKPTNTIIPPPKTNETKKDTAAPVAPGIVAPQPAPTIVVKSFSFKPADPHYVVVVLDKVDPVYASEAKNAFNRFNREKFYNKPIEISSLQMDDRYNLVLEGPFSDANAAVDYIDNVRPVTGSRILPWLNAEKYSYLVISAENLDVLKTNRDMNAYKQLIQQAFPGKF